MIALICALALQQQQTITFTHPCAHSAVVLEKLGEQAGLVLKPSGSVNKDYIVVSFHDVPIATALDKIATTLNARWIEKNGVRYLERTPAQETQDFEQEYNERAAAIKSALAKVRSTQLTTGEAESLAAKVRDFGEARTAERWTAYQPIAQQLPAHKAMAELVQLLDLGRLVRSTREVNHYSSRGGDTPFPAGSKRVLDTLAKEWALYAEASARVGVAATDSYQKFTSNAQGLGDNLQLSVEVLPSRVRLQLNFLADNAWNALAYQDVPFLEGSEVPKWVHDLRELSVRSRSAEESVQPTALREVRPKFKEALLSGDDGDAILSAPGQLVQQAAMETGSSMIAALPDEAYLHMAKTEGANPGPVGVTLASLIERGILSVERESGWLLIRPKQPYSARLIRLDRNAFAKMLRMADASQSLDLDSFADFVATTTSDETVEVASHAIGRTFELESGIPISSIDSIRIYGLLNQADRSRSKIENVLISGRQDIVKFAIPLAGLARIHSEMGEGGATRERRAGKEQEDALASLPNNIEWAIRTSDVQYIQPYLTESQVGRWMFAMDAETFAMNRALSQRPGATSQYDFSAVAEVRGSAVNIHNRRLDNQGGGVTFGRYVDPLKRAKYGPYSSLPDSLRQAVEKAEKSLPAWANGGGG